MHLRLKDVHNDLHQQQLQSSGHKATALESDALLVPKGYWNQKCVLSLDLSIPQVVWPEAARVERDRSLHTTPEMVDHLLNWVTLEYMGKTREQSRRFSPSLKSLLKAKQIHNATLRRRRYRHDAQDQRL